MLRQTATLWRRTGPDGVGGFSYEDPVSIRCRWEASGKLARSSAGDAEKEEDDFMHTIFTRARVSAGDLVALGEGRPIGEAVEVRETVNSLPVSPGPQLLTLKA